ncbi:MAG: polymer-forming cytoskeletal protein [Candidatus Omnitrophica bacterium]|nr:polymer-forming cytoskeletal protein [Candidatus Omnitrophota bacterium]
MAIRRKEKEEKMLDVDASMQGNMVFKDPVNLRINGTFEGVLDTKGSLTIGENAVVKADIKGEAIVVAGSVQGNIDASKTLKLVAPSRVIGDMKTPALSIEDGSIFEGKCRMLKSKEAKNMPNKDILSADEVAKYLEVDTSLILSWAREGKLPAVKDKDTWKFERTRLDEWITNERIG